MLMHSSVLMVVWGAGTPEGVIAAAALLCMGGSLQGKLFPRNDSERQHAIKLGYDLDKVPVCTSWLAFPWCCQG
jgi:fructose-1,6-bisphosphatase II